MEIGPDDRGNEFVMTAVSQHVDEHRKRIEILDLSRSDRDLKLHVRRGITRQCDDALADFGGYGPEVADAPDRPGTKCRILIHQHWFPLWFVGAAPDQCPQRMQPRLPCNLFVRYDFAQFEEQFTGKMAKPLGQESLRRFAE